MQPAQTASVPPPELLVPLLPPLDDAPPELPPEEAVALELEVAVELLADEVWPVEAAAEVLLVGWDVPPELELLEPP